MRVAVVGGGVVGLACAFSLVRDGHDVTVLERDRPAAGASEGNAGWVTPALSTPLAAPGMLRQGLRHAFDPRGALVIRPRLDPTLVRWLVGFARASSAARFAAGVEALHILSSATFAALDRMAAAGVGFEEHRAGLLAVARDRAGLHWFDDTVHELRRIGFAGRLTHLSGEEARALEPALSDTVGAAIHAADDRHVDPLSLVHGLVAYLAASGVTIRSGADVASVSHTTRGWRVALADGDAVEADAVVVAAALGTVGLVRPFGLRLPVVGGKGYAVTIASPDPAPQLPIYLCEVKVGVSPLARGVRLAGFFELGAPDARPSARRASQLVAEARRYLPAIPASASRGGDGWAGLRPATPDSLPFIGEVPGADGLFVATGHGMLGVTLAPATGDAIATLVRGERPASLGRFAISRFA